MKLNTYESISSVLDPVFGAVGRTDDGNPIVFARVDAECVSSSVSQGNGWDLTHYYHKDGTIEVVVEPSEAR